MESIRRTIDISVTTPEIIEEKTFGKACLIIDEAPSTEADRFVKYSSYDSVVTAIGSNTETEKFARRYFNNRAYGGVAPFIWILKIDLANEDLETKLVETLKKPEDYYSISTEADFTNANKLLVAKQVDLFADNKYMCVFEETSADAYDVASTDDLASVLKTAGYQRAIAHYSPKDGSGNNQYLSGALCGEMTGVEYTASRGKYEFAKKSYNLVEVNGLTDDQLGVLIDKNYNYYTETTTVKDNKWMGLNSRSVQGDPFGNMFAEDYMWYNLTVALINLVKNTPIIGFDRGGFGIIESTLTSRMTSYGNADILSIDGETSDGELFPNGFKIVMPELSSITPADKLAGNLKGIVIRYLPKYSVTAYEIQLNAQI